MVDHAVIEIQVLSLHLVYKVEQRLEHRISTIAVCDVLSALVADLIFEDCASHHDQCVDYALVLDDLSLTENC